jgi:hypothetical protein
MVGGDGCAVNAHPCPGVPVEAKPEAGAVTDSTIPHLPLECGSRYCAQHRDTWRYYEDHFASVAPSVEELDALTLMDEVITRLDAYCGVDGGEPYEGGDCPHEFIGLDLMTRARKALRAALERKP